MGVRTGAHLTRPLAQRWPLTPFARRLLRPKLLKRFDLKMDDIGLWELNEAFAVQVVYCQDRLGIPKDVFNVDGGAISIGHPYGMSVNRLAVHALIEGCKRSSICCRDHERGRRHGRGGAV